MDGLIEGFERRRLPGDGIEVDALVGGSGPPLLLLHGYPQTRVMWRAVAPALARDLTVVVPDLRGYGRSDKPPEDAAHEAYSKRTMARDQVATMAALGFDTFGVAGHDRGGRVAYRLALDHPDAVTRLAVLDIVPTAEVFANASAASARSMFHWYFLAQPAPLPETLIGADPEFFLRTLANRWSGENFVFDEDSMADYVAHFDPAASSSDYRSGWHVDRLLDEADRGKQIAAPTLVLYGEEYGVARAQPLETWQEWAVDVRAQSLPGGHFVVEECPDEVTAELREFFIPR